MLIYTCSLHLHLERAILFLPIILKSCNIHTEVVIDQICCTKQMTHRPGLSRYSCFHSDSNRWNPLLSLLFPSRTFQLLCVCSVDCCVCVCLSVTRKWEKISRNNLIFQIIACRGCGAYLLFIQRDVQWIQRPKDFKEQVKVRAPQGFPQVDWLH